MANEPTTTITGNLTADPELRFTQTGRPVAAFTIASTPRFPDRATGEWQDGETWFVRCSAWGDTAENIATSLAKGNAVVATGRLRCRTWEDKDSGAKRAAVEMTVDDIGPSLRRAVAKVTKATREHAPNSGTEPSPVGDPWRTPAPSGPVRGDHESRAFATALERQCRTSAPEPSPVPAAPAGDTAGFTDEPPF